MATEKENGKLFFVEKETATTPKSGECIVGHYWVVHRKYGVAFYAYGQNGLSPQCNIDRGLAWHGVDDDELGVEFIDVVFMAHAVKARRTAQLGRRR